jgi:hypothetical protein
MQGHLILLDLPEQPGVYWQRRAIIQKFWPMLELDAPLYRTSSLVLAAPAFAAPMDPWQRLQQVNKELGCEFYEGMVAKRVNSPYNRQTVSPEQKTSAWVKYRWDW